MVKDDARDTPPSLVDPRDQSGAMLVGGDLPEVILEVMAEYPAFAEALTAVSGGSTRLARMHVSIAALLTAHPLNVGLKPFLADLPTAAGAKGAVARGRRTVIDAIRRRVRAAPGRRGHRYARRDGGGVGDGTNARSTPSRLRSASRTIWRQCGQAGTPTGACSTSTSPCTKHTGVPSRSRGVSACKSTSGAGKDDILATVRPNSAGKALPACPASWQHQQRRAPLTVLARV